MDTVTIDHVRGLLARTPNSVLLWHRADDRVVFAAPESAYGLLTSGEYRYLCSRQDLRDSGVHRTGDGSLAAGTLARARDVVVALNELTDDDGNGIVDAA